MDPFVRNRKASPSEGHRKDDNSDRWSQSSSAPKTIGPMSLGGRAPPPPLNSQSIVYPNHGAMHSPRTVTAEAFTNSTLSSPVMKPKVPSLNIFQGSPSSELSNNHGIQNYLDGGSALTTPTDQGQATMGAPAMNVSPYVVQGQMDAYQSYQQPNPYNLGPSNNSWNPQPNYDGMGYHMKQNAFGMNIQPHSSASQSSRWSTSSPMGFFQQVKQIGQLFIPTEQVEDDLIDPPLLEELGIDVDDIMRHIKCVLLFKSCKNGELQYADFTGPVLILLLLALSLLVSCKLNFSLLYVIEVFGTWFMYLLLNMTSQDVYIEMAKTAIILGYSLLPICLVPLIWLFSGLSRSLAWVLIYLCVGWSTSTASRLLTQELNMESRKYLVIYPTLLYYLFFAHVAIS